MVAIGEGQKMLGFAGAIDHFSESAMLAFSFWIIMHQLFGFRLCRYRLCHQQVDDRQQNVNVGI